jgi:thiamine pyrophosphokinase
MKHCIILANGKPPAKRIIEYLQKKYFAALICADGGADYAKKMKLIPDFIIGDLDSVEKSTLKFYEKKSKIIRIKRQNDTDVEKCLKFAIKKKFENIFLTGVTGDRLDHTFCNLGIAIKFHDKININIIAENSFLSVHQDKVDLDTHKGETVSLYGFDEKTKIASKGLKYSLLKTALPFGKKDGTSNIATSKKLILNITGGKIFIIRDFNTMKKYGFI